MSPLGSRFSAPFPVILDLIRMGCRKFVKTDPHMREKISNKLLPKEALLNHHIRNGFLQTATAISKKTIERKWYRATSVDKKHAIAVPTVVVPSKLYH